MLISATTRETIKGIRPLYPAIAFYHAVKLALMKASFSYAVAKETLYDLSFPPKEYPLPPPRLRHRISAFLDANTYLVVGKTLAQNIRDLCRVAGRNINSFENILDFGCGCGRILRNFNNLPGSCRLYGSDIDAAAIRWCDKNLRGIDFRVNGAMPPLPYPDNFFDLIYAVSVFTHIDEEMQHAWLQELKRVSRPGAIIIATVMGSCAPDVTDFKFSSAGKWKMDGLPEFYQVAFHSHRYVKRVWSQYFEIIKHVDRAINNHQDAIVMRVR